MGEEGRVGRESEEGEGAAPQGGCPPQLLTQLPACCPLPSGEVVSDSPPASHTTAHHSQPASHHHCTISEECNLIYMQQHLTLCACALCTVSAVHTCAGAVYTCTCMALICALHVLHMAHSVRTCTCIRYNIQ